MRDRKNVPEGPRIRQPIHFADRLAELRGSTVELELSSYDAALDAIHHLREEMAGLDRAALLARSEELRVALRDPASGDLLPVAFALACEAAERTVGLRPYPVQILAALALDAGRIVEMRTGEGKTLAAVLTAYYAALSGRGVHVLTFNDYLARRDAEWMGPIYTALGLSVGWIAEGMSPEKRRRSYGADVTYVTAKEAGFDLLRDALARTPEEAVHRPPYLAIVDEADSLMIDEARVPLVIAGSALRTGSSAPRLAALVAELEPGIDYDMDEYQRNVELTERGHDRVEHALGENLLAEENYVLYTELHCALHAHVLLRRDIDYLVRDGRLELIDELTGRVVDDRHWPDGLQAALEAKEGLELGADGRILGSTTLRHVLLGYERLCGMTGTARDAARELHDLYGLGVTVVPTHRPMVRLDPPDVVFTHRGAKLRALVEEIRRAHATGRPVLVGTASVAESEELARRLELAGISHEVLNARNDAREAEIVARAGAFGAVTISTNMAGRGTDIRLGGADGADHARVAALGGLYVLGTSRHESRRVDLQLRGRAGRQGDPGESRFFISLEDDLLVRYGIDRLIPPRFFPERRDAPLDNPVIRREIDRAQRILEGQNSEIRKTLDRYAEPIEDQRRIVLRRRQGLLFGRAEPEVWRRVASRRRDRFGR